MRGSLTPDTSRHEDELNEKFEYAQNNPVNKGLVDTPRQYRWLFVARKITG